MLHARKLATFQIFCNFKSYFLGHYRAVPNRFLHVPVTQAFHDGCIQSFVLVIFPVIATFFSDDILRQVSRAFGVEKWNFWKQIGKNPKSHFRLCGTAPEASSPAPRQCPHRFRDALYVPIVRHTKCYRCSCKGIRWPNNTGRFHCLRPTCADQWILNEKLRKGLGVKRS